MCREMRLQNTSLQHQAMISELKIQHEHALEGMGAAHEHQMAGEGLSLSGVCVWVCVGR
jgi:hypothetical protein